VLITNRVNRVNNNLNHQFLTFLKLLYYDRGEKMAGAFRACFAEGFREVVLIGSDSPDLPREIIAAAGASAFDLAIAYARPIFRMIAAVASFRSRLTRIPYGDQAHFFRADYFREIGGYAQISLMEDVEIMRRIKKRKDKIAIIRQSVSTSARRWEKEGILICTLRNWLLLTLYLCGCPPDYLSRAYR
jgi:hypothetical protein